MQLYETNRSTDPIDYDEPTASLLNLSRKQLFSIYSLCMVFIPIVFFYRKTQGQVRGRNLVPSSNHKRLSYIIGWKRSTLEKLLFLTLIKTIFISIQFCNNKKMHITIFYSLLSNGLRFYCPKQQLTMCRTYRMLNTSLERHITSLI